MKLMTSPIQNQELADINFPFGLLSSAATWARHQQSSGLAALVMAWK